MRDLSGQTFGMLKVKEMVVKSPYAKKSYLCECKCGNICTRLESTLLDTKHISSCGCYVIKNLQPGTPELCRKAGLNRKNAFVNESNVSMTFRNGTIKTNTSGAQGVSWSGTAKKWHAYIGYKSYRCNLGFYENIEDAKITRLRAEEAVKNNTFEEFFEKLRGFPYTELKQEK